MKNIYKNSLLFIIFIVLLLFRGTFLKLFNKNFQENINETALKLENDNLKQELSNYLKDIDTTKYLNYDYKISRIIFTNFNDLYNTGLVLVGKSDGIKKGDLVMNDDGLIGIIREVRPNSSVVDIITGTKELSVKINDTYGILSNYNKLDEVFTISKIDNYENIKVGDKVYTSGLGEFKPGIFVGNVVAIHKDEFGLEQNITMSSDISFNNLNYVIILSGNNL